MFIGKPRDWWLEWGSTVVLIIGVTLTAYNVYPLNIWISFAGNLLWLATSLVWRKWSLMVVQLIISLIYVGGLIKIFVG
jgi:hypothetical protein